MTYFRLTRRISKSIQDENKTEEDEEEHKSIVHSREVDITSYLKWWSPPPHDGTIQTEGKYVKPWTSRWYICKHPIYLLFINNKIGDNLLFDTMNQRYWQEKEIVIDILFRWKLSVIYHAFSSCYRRNQKLPKRGNLARGGGRGRRTTNRRGGSPPCFVPSELSCFCYRYSFLG